MGMVVVSSKAGQGGKEIFEGGDVDKDGKETACRQWWGRGSNYGDRCFNDRWRNVLNWDVLNGDVVDDITGKLELGPVVLVKQGEEDIEFFLGDVDDVGGGFFTKLFKIELSHSAKGFEGGLQSRWGQGSDNVGTGVNRVGLKGV